MEIDTNDPVLMSVCPEVDKKAEKSSGSEFGKIFEDLIENKDKIDSGGEKAPLINKISAIQLSPFLPVGENSIIESAEKMLDMLDEYQRKLANPEATLREISPLVNKLEMDKEGLVSAVNSFNVGEELKDILSHMVIISSIEIIKFKRGEYVNP